ncbi:MAG: LysR family transcriptional regulator [Sphaerochaetaceae bacterium]|nr:LysR family transcriptional regulator [Sphaerochaetaceae bacterium]
MDSRKLEILVTVTDLGSFSKASEVVGYTQSGLTHMMDSLENEIGFPVLERGHRGITLNENGKILIPLIKEFLRTNTELNNKIDEMKTEKSGTVRVAAYASMALNWLPQILYNFRRTCPDVNIDLRMVDHAIEPFELLDSGKTDIIFASRQEKMNCTWIPLYKEPLYAILPSSYPIASRKTFPVEEFSGKEFLMPYGQFDKEVKKALGPVITQIVENNAKVDDETVMRMVGHGLGLSIMSELMIRGPRDSVMCVPLDPPAFRELGIGIKSESYNHYSIRSLIDCVNSMIGSLTSK